MQDRRRQRAARSCYVTCDRYSVLTRSRGRSIYRTAARTFNRLLCNYKLPSPRASLTADYCCDQLANTNDWWIGAVQSWFYCNNERKCFTLLVLCRGPSQRKQWFMCCIHSYNLFTSVVDFFTTPYSKQHDVGIRL